MTDGSAEKDRIAAMVTGAAKRALTEAEARRKAAQPVKRPSELGGRKGAATIHDLRDAVATARRGDMVLPPHPEAVGCLLPEPTR